MHTQHFDSGTLEFGFTLILNFWKCRNKRSFTTILPSDFIFSLLEKKLFSFKERMDFKEFNFFGSSNDQCVQHHLLIIFRPFFQFLIFKFIFWVSYGCCHPFFLLVKVHDSYNSHDLMYSLHSEEDAPVKTS